VERLQKYVEDLHAILDELPLELIHEVINILQEARWNQRQIFVMGNGGSASTASHFVADLAKNARSEGLPPFRVIGLTDNIAYVTALANDEGYENIFSQQLANFVRPYDVVIGISTSGNSKNVIKAIELAKSIKAKTIGFTGYDGGKLGELVDIHVHIPSSCVEQVEDIHLLLEHMIVKTIKETAQESQFLPQTIFMAPSLNVDTFSSNGKEPGTNGKADQASFDLLYAINQKLRGQLELSEVMQGVLDLTVERLGASSGSIMLFDEVGGVFEAALTYPGLVDQIAPDKVKDVAQRGLAGWVAENKQSVLVDSTHDDPRWLKRGWETSKGASRSAMSVPLIDDNRVVGVMTIVHQQAGQFTKEDLILLTAVAVFVSAKGAQARTTQF
jgi:D-sedoheptulose 7-phosphate isomerase